MVAFFCDVLYFADGAVRVRNYVALDADGETPVAAASTVYDEGAPYIVLAGSAVLESHRGRGIYRALVKRRLADVRGEGIEAALIQAVRATSAPICRALGFEEQCTQELWSWTPPA